MEIYVVRDVETSSRDVGVIRTRIDRWASENGFVLSDDEAGILDYKRGSHLKASLSFFIRHVPTCLTVNINGINAGLLRCSVYLNTRWAIEAPGDTKRVEKILDRLAKELSAVDG